MNQNNNNNNNNNGPRAAGARAKPAAKAAANRGPPQVGGRGRGQPIGGRQGGQRPPGGGQPAGAVPPPQQQQGAAAVPAVRIAPVINDLQTSLNRYHFSKPTKDPLKLLALQEELSLPNKVSWRNEFKNHPASAFYRDVATWMLLKTQFLPLYNNAARPVNVLLPYGSPRESAAFQYSNRFQLPHRINAYVEGQLYPGDENNPRNPVPQGQPVDFCLITDVYHLTRTEIVQWSQRVNGAGAGTVWIILHDFTGEGGVELPEEREGIWYKENGLVHYRASVHDTMYTPHPDSAFLFQKHFIEGGNSYTIKHFRKVGNMYILSITPSVGGARDERPHTVTPSNLLSQPPIHMSIFERLRTLPLPMLWHYKPKELKVWDLGVKNIQFGAAISSFNWAVASSTVKTELDRCPSWRLFSQVYTDYAVEVFEDTVAYYYYGRLKEHAWKLSLFHSLTYGDQKTIASVRAGTQPDPWYYNVWLWRVAFLWLFSKIGVDITKKMIAYTAKVASASEGLVDDALIIPKVTLELGSLVTRSSLKFIREFVSRKMQLSPLPDNPVYCYIGPLLEEVVKSYVPETALALSLLESHTFPEFLGRSVIHVGLSLLPLHIAVPCHYLINYLSRQSFHYQKQWIDLYNQQVRFQPPDGVYPLPVGQQLNSAEFLGRFPQKTKLETPGYFPDLPLEEGVLSPGVHPIMPVFNLPFKPRRNARNLQASLLRIASPPFEVNKEWPGWAAAEWAVAHIWFVELTGQFTVQDYINSIDDSRKRLRAQNALSQVERGDHLKFLCSVHTKTDETLFLKEVVDEEGNTVTTIVPRAIINIDPKIQNIVQPTVMEMTYKLKTREWWYTPKRIKSQTGRVVEFFVFYAAGAAFDKIAEAFTFACQQEAWVFFQAGDDNMFKTPDGRWFEGDYSKFDQTQTECAARFERTVHRVSAMPVKVSDLLHEQFTQSYIAEHKDYKIKRGTRCGRATGGGNTSLGNTIVGASAIITCLLYYECGTDNLPVTMSKMFGMVLKLRETLYPTFLKGWFVPSALGFVWMPLPSMILKVGKVLTDPKKITGIKDPQEAVALTARSVALSFGSVPIEYPILGPFLYKMTQFSDKEPVDVPFLEGRAIEYGVNNRSAVLAMISYRYELEETTVIEIENLISSVTILPSLLVHPAFLALERADYA
jgi:hypothetical protein